MRTATTLFALSLIACGGDVEHAHAGVEEDIAALQSTIDALTADLTAANAALDAQATAFELLEDEVAAISGGIDVSELDASVTDHEARLAALELDPVTKTYVDAQDAALQTTVDAHTTSIAAVQASVGTNAADIATHTSALAAQATTIASNTTQVGVNTTAIASHTTGIAVNLSAINTHSGQITTHTTAIADHATAIGANTTATSDNAAAIAANSAAIAAHSTAVGDNAAAISGNTSAISGNASAISGNASSISSLTADLAAQGDNLLGGTVNTPGTTCADLLAGDSTLEDGAYWLTGDSGNPYQAWCDMTTDGGGWTLLGTIYGGDANSWNDRNGFWSNTQTAGSASSPFGDHKSAAWHDMALTGSDILYERRYDGDMMAQTVVDNACLTDGNTGTTATYFSDLFVDFNDFQTPCATNNLTTLTPAVDATGVSGPSYQEGSGASALGGTGTNGFCWNGGDNNANTFSGHMGWNQSAYTTCMATGHLAYIGVFTNGDAQYSNLDIDGTNWLSGTTLALTGISVYAR